VVKIGVKRIGVLIRVFCESQIKGKSDNRVEYEFYTTGDPIIPVIKKWEK